MKRSVLGLAALGIAIAACATRESDPAPGTPECFANLVLVAPRPGLHYATDAVAIATITKGPGAPYFTSSAIDGAGRAYQPMAAGSASVDQDVLEWQWSFQLAPSERYQMTVTDGQDCTQSVTFFTSP